MAIHVQHRVLHLYTVTQKQFQLMQNWWIWNRLVYLQCKVCLVLKMSKRRKEKDTSLKQPKRFASEYSHNLICAHQHAGGMDFVCDWNSSRPNWRFGFCRWQSSATDWWGIYKIRRHCPGDISIKLSSCNLEKICWEILIP